MNTAFVVFAAAPVALIAVGTFVARQSGAAEVGTLHAPADTHSAYWPTDVGVWEMAKDATLTGLRTDPRYVPSVTVVAPMSVCWGTSPGGAASMVGALDGEPSQPRTPHATPTARNRICRAFIFVDLLNVNQRQQRKPM
jgi:hypothetical protein